MADGKIIIATDVDSSGLEKGLSKLGGIASKGMAVAVGAIAATGTALFGLGAYATKTSIDFESAFAGVRKTVDASEEEFQKLSDGIRDMSKRLPQSAADIAVVAEAAGQLGIEKENILGFTETMVMLGDATNLSSEEAATSLARLANITGMAQTDFDKLGSVIVDLGNNFATTESEIVEMSLRLAGTGNQVGMSESQILALSAAMSSVGINAEAGGSSMSRVMQKINTDVLSGGEGLEKFAEISGMSADEFSRQWKEKPDQAIVAFVDGLGKIQESGGDVASALSDMGISSIQEIDTLLRLSGASDTLAEALGISAEAWEENTALMTEAEQRYATAESKIAILKNNITDLAISLGDELKGSLIDVIDQATGMVDQLADAFEVGGIEGLVAEIGTVLADVVNMIGEYLPGMVDMGINLINALIDGLLSNMDSIMGSISTVLVQLVEGALKMLPRILELGIQIIIQLALGIAEALPTLIPVAVEAILGLVDTLLDNIDLILDAGLQLILGLAIGLIDAIPKLIERLPEIIEKLMMGLLEFCPELVLAGIELLAAIGIGLIQAIPALLMAIPEIISGLIAGFTEKWPKIQEEFQKGLTDLNNKFNEKWEDLKVKTSEKWGELKKNLSDDWESIKQTSKTKAEETVIGIAENWAENNRQSLEKWTELKDNVTQKATELKDNANKAITLLKDNLPGLWESIKTTASNKWQETKDNVTTKAGELRTNASNVITRLRDDLPGWWQSIKDTAIQKWQEIKDGIMGKVQGLPEDLYNLSVNMINRIVDGIKDTAENVYNNIKELVDKIIRKFKDGLGIESPSTVLRDIGKNMIYGLIDGLKPDSVISFAKKILDDIVETFKAGKLNFQATIEFLGSGMLEFFRSIGIGGSDFGNLVVPVDGGITSHFGYRSAESTDGVGSTNHMGIDIGAGYGTTVGASGAGEVTMAGWNGGYGKTVMIDHGNGLKTLYAHLSEILVSVGQLVTQMQAIGLVGSTGNSTGAHLHFGVMQDGVWVDPRSIWGLATGTNRVPQTGLYKLHKDEAVVPKRYNPALSLSPQIIDKLTSVVIAESAKIGNKASAKEQLNSSLGFFRMKDDNKSGERLDKIKGLLADILNKDNTMVLDTGVLVGHTVDKYDTALNDIYVEKRRGIAR